VVLPSTVPPWTRTRTVEYLSRNVIVRSNAAAKYRAMVVVGQLILIKQFLQQESLSRLHSYFLFSTYLILAIINLLFKNYLPKHMIPLFVPLIMSIVHPTDGFTD